MFTTNDKPIIDQVLTPEICFDYVLSLDIEVPVKLENDEIVEIYEMLDKEITHESIFKSIVNGDLKIPSTMSYDMGLFKTRIIDNYVRFAINEQI